MKWKANANLTSKAYEQSPTTRSVLLQLPTFIPPSSYSFNRASQFSSGERPSLSCNRSQICRTSCSSTVQCDGRWIKAEKVGGSSQFPNSTWRRCGTPIDLHLLTSASTSPRTRRWRSWLRKSSGGFWDPPDDLTAMICLRTAGNMPTLSGSQRTL